MKHVYLSFLAILVLNLATYGQNSCAEALEIEAGLHFVPAVEGEEVPFPICASNGEGADNGMWYVYNPSDTFNLVITTSLPQNEGGDTRFHIYTGDCDSLICVGGDDDGGSVYLSIFFLDVFPEETYYIAFDDRWSDAGFDFMLIEEEYVPPLPELFSFTPAAYELPGSMRGAVDMNGDYLDDLVYAEVSQVNIAEQQENGEWVEVNIPTDPVTNIPSWSMAAGDVDANGWNDLVYGGGSGASVLFRSDDGTSFEEWTTEEFIFSQRSNMIDINNDGHLDVFVCHDIDTNVYFINDGLGNLQFNRGGLGDVPNGGNYGSIWTDYDNDGDIDMFIAKCRGGNNIIKINEMHRNNGDGTYTEVGEEIGLADPVQTWSSAWGDYDNDGDMDVFVGASSFSDGMHKVMINNGDGTFSDITEGSGLENLQSTSIEWVCHDFDNNGFIDIMGGGGNILQNNGDFTFTPTAIDFWNGPVGDLNNDGFLDVLSGSTIYYNDGNDNNYIKIHTVGTTSNINGIGARIEVHTPSFSQIREVRSGDGFRYMSSLNAHFGLGTDTQIDSVVVHWPSGITNVFTDVEINTLLVVTESSNPLSTENETEIEFVVYPNPAHDELFVDTPEGVQGGTISIFDVQGKQVKNQILNSNRIDVSTLETGSYVLRFSKGEIRAEQKFFKQ